MTYWHVNEIQYSLKLKKKNTLISDDKTNLYKNAANVYKQYTVF